MAATKTTKRAKKTDSGSQKDQIAKLDPNEKLVDSQQQINR